MEDGATKVRQVLEAWKASLDPKLEQSGLYARSPIAHKWKAPFRSLILRECAFWRVHDLLTQSLVLFEADHLLGARILLRSSFETLALLVYLNQMTAKVLAGTMNFHVFSNKTSQLLLGSKDKSTKHVAVNVVTVLGHADKRYPGILDLYGNLSESAHPNFEGMCIGYSTVDHANFVTHFGNRWAEIHGETHLTGILACMEIFEVEYNDVWAPNAGKLERWIEANDAELGATK